MKINRRIRCVLNGVLIAVIMVALLHPGRFSLVYSGSYLSTSSKLVDNDLQTISRISEDLNIDTTKVLCSKKQRRKEEVIIIPYRNRPRNLQILISYLANYFQSSMPSIVVMEQSGDKPFNRGKLFNVGYSEIVGGLLPEVQCLILHDVDLLPVGVTRYRCKPHHPTHISSSIDKFRYNLPYPSMTGGVLAIDVDDYKDMNGFSNLYTGWGGEDDDFFNRMEYLNLKLERSSPEEGMFMTLAHTPQMPDPKRFDKLLKMDRNSGLKDLEYSIVNLSTYSCYTHIIVDIG